MKLFFIALLAMTGNAYAGINCSVSLPYGDALEGNFQLDGSDYLVALNDTSEDHGGYEITSFSSTFQAKYAEIKIMVELNLLSNGDPSTMLTMVVKPKPEIAAISGNFHVNNDTIPLNAVSGLSMATSTEKKISLWLGVVGFEDSIGRGLYYSAVCDNL